LISPKRASSNARIFSGFLFLGGRSWPSRLTLPANFFKVLLLVGVGFLVPRTARFELDLASPQELADAVGVGVRDAMSLAQELIGLADRGDLPPLHDLLQILKGFGRDQLLTAALTHPALQKLLKPALFVACEPPLTLTPAVAQRLCRLSQVTALLGS